MKVLLVEDEPAIADTLVYALRTERFDVHHTLTGQAALEAIGEGSFDFVILDIGLPDMTGLDVCRRLRESSTVPVLFLTARDGEIDRILGLELGGDDYVTKPFSPREIVARIRAILRRSAPARTPLAIAAPASAAAATSASASELPVPFAGCPFEHDVSGMRIHCHGTPLDLTAHEYKLMLVFLKNPRRVLTRDQLLDHAWSDPGAVTDRTIDAHIKTIRSKLRAARQGAEDFIQTRRGIGYLFVP